MTHIQTDPIAERTRLLRELAQSRLLSSAAQAIAETLKNGGKVLAFGNGGSATQSSHFAAELVNRFARQRPALAAISLACDPACLTSIANDSEYAAVFSRQLEALGRRGDVALALTTGGKSPNILAALETAKRLGLATIVCSGRFTGALAARRPDILLAVDSDATPIIQEMHLFLLHAIAEQVEYAISGGSDA